jgi:predicted N-acetyltransferase YhbS
MTSLPQGPWPQHPQEQESARRTVLRRINRWQAEKQREDLADLSVECCSVEPGQEFRHREEFVRRLVADARHPGFDMLLAETATLVGFVFGVPVDRDGAWWHGFAITDLAVHPYVRQHGVTGQLLERLLGDHHASLGAALVDQADQVAYAAFRSSTESGGLVHDARGKPPGTGTWG